MYSYIGSKHLLVMSRDDACIQDDLNWGHSRAESNSKLLAAMVCSTDAGLGCKDNRLMCRMARSDMQDVLLEQTLKRCLTSPGSFKR